MTVRVQVGEPPEAERDVAGPLIGAREVHVYGGLVLLWAGGEMLHAGIGFVAVAAVMIYMGVWRM